MTDKDRKDVFRDGPSDITMEHLGEILREHPRPFTETKAILGILAIHDTLRGGVTKTADQIAREIEADRSSVLGVLHSASEDEHPWVEGRQQNEKWFWSLTEEGRHPFTQSYAGESILTEKGRSAAASKLLRELDIEIPIEEISPAIAMMDKVTSSLQISHLEDEILSIAKRKSPTWATARGFNESYEAMKKAAGRVRPGQLLHTDPIHQLMIYTGAGMHEAHCIVVDVDQILALPEWESTATFAEFMKGVKPPFEPLFIDLTGGDDGKYVAIETNVTPSKEIVVLGALVDFAPTTEDVLLITPVFYYPDDPIYAGKDAQRTVTLGMFAVNQSDNPKATFQFGPDVTEFKPGARMMVLVSDSAALGKAPDEIREQAINEYEVLIESAANRIGQIFYMMESANVEIVDRPLERRDAKRAEKRNWNIPATVRVQRPAKRYRQSSNGNGATREFSHQFEVIGHYKHVTKGTHVRCKSCLGNPLENVGCSRCKGTGLDPDKVKPCIRIDVATGELTCPNGCRRELVPTHVKGPEDKPLIPKVRVIT